jgi:hypothetical protein
MIWYVAIVALVNLGLGYGLALLLGKKRGDVALASTSVESGDSAAL